MVILKFCNVTASRVSMFILKLEFELINTGNLYKDNEELRKNKYTPNNSNVINSEFTSILNTCCTKADYFTANIHI